MPRYKVIEPGFFGGKYYHPEGKRPVLEVDKPFNKKNPMPKWVSDMPKESPALKEKREALEKAQAELEKAKASEQKDAIKAASSDGAGEAQSFLGDAKDANTGSKVETL